VKSLTAALPERRRTDFFLRIWYAPKIFRTVYPTDDETGQDRTNCKMLLKKDFRLMILNVGDSIVYRQWISGSNKKIVCRTNTVGEFTEKTC
jgi:hypothetical protein